VNYETLLCEVKDQIARVTLNRPQVLHALNAMVFNELEQVFMALTGDVRVRVILLTGAGEKAFAAGADINEIARLDIATGEAKARRGQEVFRMIETCGKPVIACINGFALGGGCELAMACTMRLASETARMGQPEVKLGLIPGYGGTQRLPRLVGAPMALKLLLTGEMIGAAEALRSGWLRWRLLHVWRRYSGGASCAWRPRWTWRRRSSAGCAGRQTRPRGRRRFSKSAHLFGWDGNDLVLVGIFEA